MNLPRTYKNRQGNYPQHKGKPKISYSQYSSFKNPQYRSQSILQYVMNHWDGPQFADGVYADFGGDVGTYIENKGQGKPYKAKMLTDDDLAIIDDNVPYKEDTKYETEVVVDFGDFVMEGYIDEETDYKEGVDILDTKTGNVKKKVSFYGGDTYCQTDLYAYGRKQEGKKIKNGVTRVRLFGRKGSHINPPMGLSGECETIERPYTDKRVNAFKMDVEKVAKDIASVNDTYGKLKQLEISF